MNRMRLSPMPRLNPFAFPADTDIRFVVLIVAVLCTSLFLYDSIYYAVPLNVASVQIGQDQCLVSALSAYPHNSLTLETNYLNCRVPISRIEGIWALLGIILVFTIAFLLYLLWPIWKIKIQRLKPLKADNEVKVHILTYLSKLCQEVGLSRSPIFLTTPLSPLPVAFGCLGQYYITVPSASIIEFQSDVSGFRAIMLHELGHIRNADIDKTYFSLAVGYAFGFIALLPWTLVQIFVFKGINQSFVGEVVRIFVLTALIYLTLNALLRDREIYADIRASVWEGPEGALKNRLKKLKQPKKNPLHHLFITHPNPQVRLRVVDNTTELFLLKLWPTFIIGLVVASAMSNIVWLINLLHIEWIFTISQITALGAGLAFSTLIVGAVGVNLWRATFAKEVVSEHLSTDVSLPSIIGVSISLTLGLLLGQFLSLYSYLSNDGYFTNVWLTEAEQSIHLSWWNWTMLQLFWSLLLFLFLSLSLRWIVTNAANWLKITASTSSPLRVYWITSIATLIVLGVGVGEFTQVRGIVEGLLIQPHILGNEGSLAKPMQQLLQGAINMPSTNSPITLALLGGLSFLLLNALTFVMCVCVWASPLAIWFARKPSGKLALSSWAYLDTQFSSNTPSTSSPLRLRFALITGLIVGLLFCILLPLLKGGFHLSSGNNQILLAILLQAIGAVFVAGWVTRLSVAHSLFAAFIASCVMVLGILGFDNLYHELSFPNQTIFLLVMNGGTLVALPLTASISVLAHWSRSSQQKVIPMNTSQQFVGEKLSVPSIGPYEVPTVFASHVLSSPYPMVQNTTFVSQYLASMSNTSQRASSRKKFLLFALTCIVLVTSTILGLFSIINNNQATADTSSLLQTIISKQPIFADSLSNNTQGRWYQDEQCAFQSGAYHVFASPTQAASGLQSVCGLKKAYNKIFNNFAIQVQITLLTGSETGLWFRLNKTGQFYYYGFTDKEKIFLSKYNHFDVSYLIPPSKPGFSFQLTSPSVSRTNILLVICQGNTITLYLNGIFTHRFQDNASRDGSIGFTASTASSTESADAIFANLKVYQA